MKRLALVAIFASIGCANATPSEDVGKHHQALGTADDHGHGLPPIRPGQYPAGKDAAPSHASNAGSGTWTTVATTPTTLAAGFSLLLTDGSVMVQDLSTMGNTWWKLTPDASGNYVDGTWTQLAPMPNGYAPLYMASAVLPDGRVIMIGGEYQAFQPAWQAQGAIYDPSVDRWTPVAPPDGWQNIGDAQSVVLPDGRFVLANPFTTEMAVLNPTTLTWTSISSAGKADIFDEEGWTLLWNGSVLTVDANNTGSLTNSEIFFPGSKRKPAGWSSAGSTISPLADLHQDNSGSHEVGAAMLRPDGTVFYVGATGHTAIYDSLRGTWKAGPDFPVVDGEGQLDQADGAAALLPNGNVLVAVSAGVYNTPAHFFEFDGAALHEVAAPASAAFDSSYNINMLLLPNGQVLETDFSGDVEIYAPQGCARDRWAPSLEDACQLHTLKAGQSASISGARLHGLSSGTSYGDDAQAATNYPLVRITNRATGHVRFARTHAFSNFAIGPHTSSDAKFDVPADIEPGDSDLVVIANGIASAPIHTHITQ